MNGTIIMNFKNKILIFGHAGGKKTAPENSLKAFKKAIELKADFIELDLRFSKDNEVVIIHDPDTLNSTGVPGLVKDKTLQQLKRLEIGEGEAIPTFREVLELIDNKIRLLLHINAPNIEKPIINLLREYNYLEKTLVSCMIHKYLFKYRLLEPNLKLAALVNFHYEEDNHPSWKIRKKFIDDALENNFYAINPEFHLVDTQFVAYAHQCNLKVYPWTINKKGDIQRMINIGVDGIISDDIPLLKSLLGR